MDVSPVVFFEAECIAADDDAGRTVLVMVMVLAIAFVLATRSATSSRFSSSDDDDESSESFAGIGGGDGGFGFDAGVFAFFLCSGVFASFVGAGPKPKSIRGLAPLGTVIFPTSTFSSFGAGSPLGLDAMTGAVLTARSIRARIARGLVPGRSFHRDTNNVGGRSPTDSFNCKNKTRRQSNCPYKD